MHNHALHRHAFRNCKDCSSEVFCLSLCCHVALINKCKRVHWTICTQTHHDDKRLDDSFMSCRDLNSHKTHALHIWDMAAMGEGGSIYVIGSLENNMMQYELFPQWIQKTTWSIVHFYSSHGENIMALHHCLSQNNQE